MYNTIQFNKPRIWKKREEFLFLIHTWYFDFDRDVSSDKYHNTKQNKIKLILKYANPLLNVSWGTWAQFEFNIEPFAILTLFEVTKALLWIGDQHHFTQKPTFGSLLQIKSELQQQCLVVANQIKICFKNRWQVGVLTFYESFFDMVFIP